jgi:hypothetical protein
MTPDGRYEYGKDDLCTIHLRINDWQYYLAGLKEGKPIASTAARVPGKVRVKGKRRHVTGRPWGRPRKPPAIASVIALDSS